MASTEISRPATPPHHPTFGVHMPEEIIRNIISARFTGSKILSIDKLPTGKSYNNRIYLIRVLLRTEINTPALPKVDEPVQELEAKLVMKVNGRFFGANKVENEVGCLQVLETFCPDIPIPQVYAWSGNGTDVTFVSTKADPQVSSKRIQFDQETNSREHGGWILMSRLPGKPISDCNLDESAMTALTRQMAEIVTSWRRNIPYQKYCGNLRIFPPSEFDGPEDLKSNAQRPNSDKILIRGVLMDDLQCDQPITSLDDYYKLRLERKLKDLETKKSFEPNRASLGPFVRKFIAETLPTLLFENDLDKGQDAEGKFAFTHYDLSPRNILITENPLRISGIIDFEFSGFFSPIEEFLNDAVGNEGDWPKAAYDAYLERLEENGIKTPGRGVEKNFWDKSKAMEEFVAHIAPWWLDTA